MGIKDRIQHYYEHEYRKLLIIPMLILLLAIVQIGYQTYTTGEFVNRGVSLKGGTIITIIGVSTDIGELETALKNSLPGSDVTVRALHEKNALAVEVADANSEAVMKIVKEKIPGLTSDKYTLRQIGSSLGSSFFRQTMIAMLIAFICMAIVVFITFRTFVPSAAVVLAAFSDIVVTIAIFNLLEMKLSIAGIAAFLMLIGYSVDTDIVLTTNVIKRKFGTLTERIYASVWTGSTMVVCTFAALIVCYLLFESDVVRQIMIILMIGLIVDMIMTWIQNVAILRIYAEKKGLQ